MSISSSGNEIETSAGRQATGGSTTQNNRITFEASEDRELHGVLVSNNQSDCISEVSFRNDMLTNANDQDPIASGVVALVQGPDNSYLDFSAAPVHWDAGEELNVHVDNAASSTALTTVVVQYKPVGDFTRDRLRNR